MSRTLFENSKAALAFAAITIVGAVSMVGTSEDSGMLPKIADRFGKKPDYAEAPSAPPPSESEATPAPEATPVPGWYDTPQTQVFGDYRPDEPGAADTAKTPDQASPYSGGLPGAASTSKPARNPMTAPLSPNAIVVN